MGLEGASALLCMELFRPFNITLDLHRCKFVLSKSTLSKNNYDFLDVEVRNVALHYFPSSGGDFHETFICKILQNRNRHNSKFAQVQRELILRT